MPTTKIINAAHDRMCPETGLKCTTGFCVVDGACSIQEVGKHGPFETLTVSPTVYVERFKKPTAKQMIDTAIIFNDGHMDAKKLTDMVAMCEFVIDRLYENGDMSIPSSK